MNKKATTPHKSSKRSVRRVPPLYKRHYSVISRMYAQEYALWRMRMWRNACVPVNVRGYIIYARAYHAFAYRARTR